MSTQAQLPEPLSAPTGRITFNLLIVSMVNGAAGAPLVGALREQAQEAFGLSRWSLGAGAAAIGLAAGAAGLALASRLPHVTRLGFIRAGLLLALAGFGSFLFAPAESSLAVIILTAGWFILTLGRGLAAISNAVFTDLWQHAPHTGVMLLHATNSLGKLVAPLLALLLTAAVRPNAAVYTAVLALLCLDAWTWPAGALRRIARAEGLQRRSAAGASLLRRPAFWLICLEFFVIAGSEAGVASILPSFIETHRSPLGGLSARGWSEVVLSVMLLGIVAGRFAGFFASRVLGERAIISACLLCLLAAAPAVLSREAAVYLPCFFVLGIVFSATWPTNFALAARRFPHDKTVLSMGAVLGTLAGVNGFVLLASLIGNDPARLPLAVAVSAGSMVLFAARFYLRPKPAA